MAQRVGTTVWLDVSSNLPDQAMEFYHRLLGWDHSAPDAVGYRTIRSGDALVGGLVDVRSFRCPDGGADPAPAAWTVYLAVDDLAARTAAARAAGGQVVLEDQSAGSAGRWALVIDPTGAAVGLWQAGDTESYDFTGRPGSPVWFELVTGDFAAATEFYRTVFDFEITPMPGAEADFRYATNGAGDAASSGIFGAPWLDARQGYWRVYFAVDGADAAAERVTALGGTVTDGPENSPFGRVLGARDPEGATFQLVSTDEAVPDE